MSRMYIEGLRPENVGDGVLVEAGTLTLVHAGSQITITDPELVDIGYFLYATNWTGLLTNLPEVTVNVRSEFFQVEFLIAARSEKPKVIRVSRDLLNGSMKG